MHIAEVIGHIDDIGQAVDILRRHDARQSDADAAPRKALDARRHVSGRTSAVRILPLAIMQRRPAVEAHANANVGIA